MGEAKDKKNEEIMELIKIAFAGELAGSDILSSFDEAELAREYNGIGPEWMPTKWRAKASDYLEIFAPAALIHDLRYSRSDGTRYAFNDANMEFRDNCLKLANAAYPWYSWKRYRARAVARILFDFVAGPGGHLAWMSAFKKTCAVLLFTFALVGCCRSITIEKHDPKPVFDSTGTNVVDYVDGGYDLHYLSLGLVTDVDGIEAKKDANGVTIKVKNLKTDVSTENKEIVGASGTAIGNVVEKAIQGAKK